MPIGFGGSSIGGVGAAIGGAAQAAGGSNPFGGLLSRGQLDFGLGQPGKSQLLPGVDPGSGERLVGIDGILNAILSSVPAGSSAIPGVSPLDARNLGIAGMLGFPASAPGSGIGQPGALSPAGPRGGVVDPNEPAGFPSIPSVPGIPGLTIAPAPPAFSLQELPTPPTTTPPVSPGPKAPAPPTVVPETLAEPPPAANLGAPPSIMTPPTGPLSISAMISAINALPGEPAGLPDPGVNVTLPTPDPLSLETSILSALGIGPTPPNIPDSPLANPETTSTPTTVPTLSSILELPQFGVPEFGLPNFGLSTLEQQLSPPQSLVEGLRNEGIPVGGFEIEGLTPTPTQTAPLPSVENLINITPPFTPALEPSTTSLFTPLEDEVVTQLTDVNLDAQAIDAALGVPGSGFAVSQVETMVSLGMSNQEIATELSELGGTEVSVEEVESVVGAINETKGVTPVAQPPTPGNKPSEPTPADTGSLLGPLAPQTTTLAQTPRLETQEEQKEPGSGFGKKSSKETLETLSTDTLNAAIGAGILSPETQRTALGVLAERQKQQQALEQLGRMLNLAPTFSPPVVPGTGQFRFDLPGMEKQIGVERIGQGT